MAPSGMVCSSLTERADSLPADSRSRAIAARRRHLMPIATTQYDAWRQRLRCHDSYRRELAAAARLEYSMPRSLLSIRLLPVFGTVDTGKSWDSQVCPHIIGDITTCHKMRHSLSLPTVIYICMRELPHFRRGPTSSFV